MLELYGDAEHFLSICTPEQENFAAREWQRAYVGMAPTLECVAEGYGMDTALVWLCLEIESINLFTAARVKLSVDRQMALARKIMAGYAYLKVSEVLLFVYRFKCGLYEKFYGAVDAQKILTSLQTFVIRREVERRPLIEAINRYRKALEEARHASEAITHKEYLRRKEEENLLNQHNQKTHHESTPKDSSE